MSAPVSLLWQKLTTHLYPTTTYHYNSGGDPEHIPELSWDELKAFYKTHYHPSNAVFMTYGDIPAFEHQARIHDQALAKFERLDVRIAVGDEQRYQQPVRVEESYALDEEEARGDKTHIVMGWLLGPSINLKQQLQAHLLEGVLLDDGASPLRYALETTGLGSAPSPLCGLEATNREMCFVCGLEGSKPENADAFEQLVLEVLEKVAEQGVALERVESVLHQLELSQREVSGDSYPYGLQLILEGLSSAVHRGDPVAALNLDPVLDELRNEIQDPAYIPGLVQQLLLNNRHRVRLAMIPDADLAERCEQAEAERLAALKAAMSVDDKSFMVRQAGALQERQQQEDDTELLPKVGLEDIPPEMPIAEGESQAVGELQTTYYNQGTNGLVYQEVVVQLPRMEEALQNALPWFTHSLSRLGCGGRDYLETQALMTAVSGGIHASTAVRGAVGDVQALQGCFILSGKALVRNHDRLGSLMAEMLESPNFAQLERIRELIAQQRARREQSVTGNGHGLAMLAASAGMSSGAALAHRTRGLQGIHQLKKLDDALGDVGSTERLAAQFRLLHDSIRSAPRQFLLIGEQERRQQAQQELLQAWTGHAVSDSGDFTAFSCPPVQHQVTEAWIANTQVNFCARAYPTVPMDHPDAPVLSVLAGFLRNGYLHRVVREQGGAYGGGASHDSEYAAFRFYSYRDPRLAETLEDFDRSIDWLLDESHDWQAVEEAILGVISALDKPGSPAGEARDAFYNGLFGRTPELRQRFRQRVLEVRLDDLRRVAGSYLVPQRASTAVVTSQAEQDNCLQLGLNIKQL
jgi:Zn-dependent M16 (insulinase) family peptidase